jgi:hypothetical protein
VLPAGVRFRDRSGPEGEQAAIVANGARQEAGVATHRPMVPSPNASIFLLVRPCVAWPFDRLPFDRLLE